jgi:multidrug resistance protein
MENTSNTRQSFGQLTILIAVATIDLLGATMVFPQIPFYAKYFKSSDTFIGVVFASFFLAQLLSAPVWGWISDHYGRRPALLIGLTALGFGYVIFALANSLWILLLARFIQGAGGGTTGVTQAYVADTVKPEDRARALGWLSAGTNVGTMVGPAVGSLLAYRGHAAPPIAAAILCALNLIFAWVWLPESRKHGGTATVRKPVWHGVWHVLRHPARLASRLTLIYALGMFGQSVMSAVLALYLNAAFGVDEYTIGYFFVYVGIFSVVLRSAFVGPAVDRLGEARAIRLGSGALILGFVGYPLAPNLWILAIVIPLIPIGTALLFPATTALLSRSTDKADYGLTMGIAQTFAGISRLIAPVTSTSMFQYVSHASPFFFAAGMLCLGSLMAGHLPSKGQAFEGKQGPVLN